MSSSSGLPAIASSNNQEQPGVVDADDSLLGGPEAGFANTSGLDGTGDLGTGASTLGGTKKSTMRRRRKRRANKKNQTGEFKAVAFPRLHQTFTGEPRPPSLTSFGTESTAWLFGGKKSSTMVSSMAFTESMASLGATGDRAATADGGGGSSTPRLDIDVMRAIVQRETLVRGVKDKSRLLLAQTRAGKPIDAEVKAMLDLLLQLRDSTLAVVEAIVAWRFHTAQADPSAQELPVFIWNRTDYAHKLCNDLDFLADSEPLVAALRISPAMLRANPFMMPANLADRAVALAHEADDAGTPPLGQAEHQLVSTSTVPAIRGTADSMAQLGRASATESVVLPPVAGASERPSAGGNDGTDAGAADADAEQTPVEVIEARLRAAEIVVLHHLAFKAGDTGLGGKLDAGSTMQLGDGPGGAAVGLDGDAEDDDDGDAPEDGWGDTTGGGGGGGDASDDPLGYTGTGNEADVEPETAASTARAPLGLTDFGATGGSGGDAGMEDTIPAYDPVRLSASVAEVPLAAQEDPEEKERYKGLEHALKKASSIYTDTSDAHAAYMRRKQAKEAADAMDKSRGRSHAMGASQQRPTTRSRSPAKKPAPGGGDPLRKSRGRPRADNEGEMPQLRHSDSKLESTRGSLGDTRVSGTGNEADGEATDAKKKGGAKPGAAHGRSRSKSKGAPKKHTPQQVKAAKDRRKAREARRAADASATSEPQPAPASKTKAASNKKKAGPKKKKKASSTTKKKASSSKKGSKKAGGGGGGNGGDGGDGDDAADDGGFDATGLRDADASLHPPVAGAPPTVAQPPDVPDSPGRESKLGDDNDGEEEDGGDDDGADVSGSDARSGSGSGSDAGSDDAGTNVNESKLKDEEHKMGDEEKEEDGGGGGGGDASTLANLTRRRGGLIDGRRMLVVVSAASPTSVTIRARDGRANASGEGTFDVSVLLGKGLNGDALVDALLPTLIIVDSGLAEFSLQQK